MKDIQRFKKNWRFVFKIARILYCYFIKHKESGIVLIEVLPDGPPDELDLRIGFIGITESSLPVVFRHCEKHMQGREDTLNGFKKLLED